MHRHICKTRTVSILNNTGGAWELYLLREGEIKQTIDIEKWSEAPARGQEAQRI